MPEPILDPGYWKERLRTAGERHHAIFRCPLERWTRIEQRHRGILAERIGPDDSVLDAGCGWGRLLTLLPSGWRGEYLGIDLSPDFIRLAQSIHGGREFDVGDLRDLGTIGNGSFDWAVMVSIRPMVRRNLGDAEWLRMEAELHRIAKRLLFLEYDPEDEGSIE